MRIIISTFVFFYTLIHSHAQYFTWAATAAGVGSGIEYSTRNVKGEILFALDYFIPEYYPFDKRFVMLGPNGDSLDLGTPSQGYVVVAMGKEGQFLFAKTASDFGNYFRLYGIASLSNGHFVLAYKVEKVPGKIKIFERDGSLSFTNQIPEWRKISPVDENINFDGSHTWTEDALVFAELTSKGEIIRSSAVRGFERPEWKDFEGTIDGGMLISRRENRFEMGASGYNAWVTYDCVTKMDSSFRVAWQHDTKEICNTSEGSYIPCMRATQSNRRIFSIGNMRGEIHPDGAAIHKARHIPYPDLKEAQSGLDSYLNCLSQDGDLLWVRYAESATIFDDVAADRNHVFVSGRMMNTNTVFGMVQDTTNGKTSFIACLDLSGKLKWTKTFHAQKIPTLDTDEIGNLNAHFHAKILNDSLPLILAKDTINSSYHQLLLAGFDSNGEVTWTKSTTVPMADNGIENTRLYHDDCGNVFVVGSMWFILPSSYACFDATFVKGIGYGGSPLIAKLQTTIPQENLALIAEVESNVFHENTHQDTIQKDEARPHDECVMMQEPWSIQVLPNPTSGDYLARFHLSYPAENIRIELYSTAGNLIKTLFTSSFQDTGTYTIADNVSELSNGAYLLILQGKGGAASARLIKTD